jgi:hypothetical protein
MGRYSQRLQHDQKGRCEAQARDARRRWIAMPKCGFPERDIYVEKVLLISPVARAIENNNSWPAPRRRGYNVPGGWKQSSQ